MAQFIHTIGKHSKVENAKTQTIENYNKKSYATQSKIDQIALVQSKVFEQLINLMGDTIEDTDIEREQKENKIEFQEKN